jgi:hypothetical protein
MAEEPIGYIAVDANGVPIITGSRWKSRTAKMYRTVAPARRLTRYETDRLGHDNPRPQDGKVLAIYLSKCEEV